VFVSVVIATRNRRALLAQTLEALARQTWASDRFEIVIADNGSTDDTRGVIERAASAPGAPSIRYLLVTTPGKSHAINAALREARGDLLALTDDDVLPEPNWIERLAAALTETNADFAAGRILPRWESAPPAWMSSALYGVLAVPDNGETRLNIGGAREDVIPIGANMAVRAAVVRHVGGLRPDLGKLEGTLRTGEDHEFFLRMLHAGYRGVYEPTALVHHWVPDERLERGYFRRWLYQNGRDVARLETDYTQGIRRFLGIPRYLWRVAAADAVTVARAVLTGDRRVRFAPLLRIVWFGAYVRESWLGTIGSSSTASRRARAFGA
jgi:glycosyltransferase involved in cell wall biosynthesis